jgi:flagellar basal body P-ring formation protein FlgA
MWRLLILCFPTAALADSVVAARVIRPGQVMVAEDVTLVAAEIPDALTDPAQALGQEARVAIYPGRPVKAANIGPAAVIERNQIVTLSYRAGGLAILTEGRALDRGGAGEVIEVTGRIGPDGTIDVGP